MNTEQNEPTCPECGSTTETICTSGLQHCPTCESKWQRVECYQQQGPTMFTAEEATTIWIRAIAKTVAARAAYAAADAAWVAASNVYTAATKEEATTLTAMRAAWVAKAAS